MMPRTTRNIEVGPIEQPSLDVGPPSIELHPGRFVQWKLRPESDAAIHIRNGCQVHPDCQAIPYVEAGCSDVWTSRYGRLPLAGNTSLLCGHIYHPPEWEASPHGALALQILDGIRQRKGNWYVDGWNTRRGYEYDVIRNRTQSLAAERISLKVVETDRFFWLCGSCVLAVRRALPLHKERRVNAGTWYKQQRKEQKSG